MGDTMCDWCGTAAAVLEGECLDCAALPGHQGIVAVGAWERELNAERARGERLAKTLIVVSELGRGEPIVVPYMDEWADAYMDGFADAMGRVRKALDSADDGGGA